MSWYVYYLVIINKANMRSEIYNMRFACWRHTLLTCWVFVLCKLFKSGCAGPLQRKTYRKKPTHQGCQTCNHSYCTVEIIININQLANRKIWTFWTGSWCLYILLKHNDCCFDLKVNSAESWSRAPLQGYKQSQHSLTITLCKSLISASVNPFSSGPTWCYSSQVTKTVQIPTGIKTSTASIQHTDALR